MKKIQVIAEIGCNHRGELYTAEEMIRIAAHVCGVDVVKFQKRSLKERMTSKQYKDPHPVPANAYGETYGAHRDALEFGIENHRRLNELCEIYGLKYSSSVWDVTSAREISGIDPPMIKVPSACNTDFGILEYLCDEYGGELHISLGMTTREEENSIVEFVERRGRNKDTVLYACVSGYPVAFEDVSLLEITRLRETYGKTVKSIGYSGHHLGIAVDVAAMALGATRIERHFTLDRTWKGTDHAASLEPDDLRRLVRDLNQVNLALDYKKEELMPVEIEQRMKLKYV